MSTRRFFLIIVFKMFFRFSSPSLTANFSRFSMVSLQILSVTVFASTVFRLLLIAKALSVMLIAQRRLGNIQVFYFRSCLSLFLEKRRNQCFSPITFPGSRLLFCSNVGRSRLRQRIVVLGLLGNPEDAHHSVNKRKAAEFMS